MEEEPIRNWRARGWVMVGAGLFLVLLMAGIARNVAPTMLRPGIEIGGTTFNGTAEEGRLFLGLFALVGLFGLISVANGAYMIAIGRRSPAGIRIVLALFLLLFGIGWAVRRGLV